MKDASSGIRDAMRNVFRVHSVMLDVCDGDLEESEILLSECFIVENVQICTCGGALRCQTGHNPLPGVIKL